MKRPIVVLALTAPLWALPGSSAAFAQPPSCTHPTIAGTAHGDRLVGTSGPDVIAGLGGHDVLIGGGGNDLLCGGAGADVLDGGSGRDRLRGGPDRITHDARIGKMSVGDRLDGGPGSDLLDGGHDRRTDSIDLSNAEPDLLDYRDAPVGVTVHLDQGKAQGYGNDRIVVRGRYDVRTTPFPDVVYGSDFQELISTRGGDDLVRAGGGGDWVQVDNGPRAGDADVVYGGRGDDLLAALGGSDLLSGGAGTDQVTDDGTVGVDRILGGAGARDLLTNVISAEADEHADGGPGERDYIWNTDPENTYPQATMICVGFEVMRDSGRWC
jgi:Ca2+-binding RTX toxin-like protein